MADEHDQADDDRDEEPIDGVEYAERAVDQSLREGGRHYWNGNVFLSPVKPVIDAALERIRLRAVENNVASAAPWFFDGDDGDAQ